MAYAIGLSGCVTIFAVHVILTYLRKTERSISAPRPRITSALPPPPESAAFDPTDLIDPRVAKIISDIPQRRTREHTYSRDFVPVR
jgi:hypothetical protein